MKHIKLFEANESDMRNFFHDKINWKFFNQLCYHLTRYEDQGIDCYIDILIPKNINKTGNFQTHGDIGVYFYRLRQTSGQYQLSYLDIILVKTAYNTSGLTYEVYIDDGEKLQEFKNDFKSNLIANEKEKGAYTIIYALK